MVPFAGFGPGPGRRPAVFVNSLHVKVSLRTGPVVEARDGIRPSRQGDGGYGVGKDSAAVWRNSKTVSDVIVTNLGCCLFIASRRNSPLVSILHSLPSQALSLRQNWQMLYIFCLVFCRCLLTAIGPVYVTLTHVRGDLPHPSSAFARSLAGEGTVSPLRGEGERCDSG